MAQLHRRFRSLCEIGNNRGIRAGSALVWAIAGVTVAVWPAAAGTPTRDPFELPPPDEGTVVGPDVVGFVVMALTLAGGIGLVVGLGRLVARVGGRPDPATPDPVARPRLVARSPRGRALQVVVVGGTIALGLVAGLVMATDLAKEGLESLSFALIGGAIILIPGGLVPTALVARKVRGSSSPFIATMLAVGGLLPISAAAGAGLFDPASVPQRVVLQASGRAQSDLSGGSLPHIAKADGTATCTSQADGTLVDRIYVEDLGELGSGTLRGSVSLIGGQTAVEILIDGADLAGEEHPSWIGSVQVNALNDDRSRGRVTVDGIIRVESEADLEAWPATLEGTIDWVCDPW